jgi:hypothetical protein
MTQQTIKEPPKRTLTQNNALHRYYELIAKSLNEIGISPRLFLEVLEKNGIEAQFSPYLVKDLIWHRVQKKILGKQSTTQLSKTGEIDLIVDAINKFFSEYFGVMGYEFIPFPSLETLMESEKNEQN